MGKLNDSYHKSIYFGWFSQWVFDQCYLFKAIICDYLIMAEFWSVRKEKSLKMYTISKCQGDKWL